MPASIQHRAQRILIAKAMLEVHRVASKAFFGGRWFGVESDCLLLWYAVFIGMAEGKPMNATKLSEYVGIPRPSVIRKLNGLAKRGLVERASNGGYSLQRSCLNSARVIAAYRTTNATLSTVGARLSKMDGDGIAAAQK